MIKGALRSAPSRKVLLTLDEETNKLLLGARERSGRTKTNEALVRLQDHLQRYHQRNHMNTVLSVQGASAPVEKKSFFSKFTCLNMLRLVRAVIPVAVLMMLFPELAMAAGKGDLMAKGQETVKATFGKNSSIVKWIVLAEVLVGAVMYMMTKNIKFLVGFAILSVFIAVGMSVAGF